MSDEEDPSAMDLDEPEQENEEQQDQAADETNEAQEADEPEQDENENENDEEEQPRAETEVIYSERGAAGEYRIITGTRFPIPSAAKQINIKNMKHNYEALMTPNGLKDSKELWLIKVPDNFDFTKLDGVSLNAEADGVHLASIRVGETKLKVQQEFATDVFNLWPYKNNKFAIGQPFSCALDLQPEEIGEVPKDSRMKTPMIDPPSYVSFNIKVNSDLKELAKDAPFYTPLLRATKAKFQTRAFPVGSNLQLNPPAEAQSALEKINQELEEKHKHWKHLERTIPASKRMEAGKKAVIYNPLALSQKPTPKPPQPVTKPQAAATPTQEDNEDEVPLMKKPSTPKTTTPKTSTPAPKASTPKTSATKTSTPAAKESTPKSSTPAPKASTPKAAAASPAQPAPSKTNAATAKPNTTTTKPPPSGSVSDKIASALKPAAAAKPTTTAAKPAASSKTSTAPAKATSTAPKLTLSTTPKTIDPSNAPSKEGEPAIPKPITKPVAAPKPGNTVPVKTAVKPVTAAKPATKPVTLTLPTDNNNNAVTQAPATLKLPEKKTQPSAKTTIPAKVVTTNGTAAKAPALKGIVPAPKATAAPKRKREDGEEAAAAKKTKTVQ